MGGMERIKGQRSERLSDKTENHHKNSFYLGRFDVEKVRFFIKDALSLYSELCFLCGRGVHFYKKCEKVRRKLKNGAEERSMASLMGICGGLVGPKSGNVDFIQVFVCFFEGQGRHGYARESFQVERAGAI